MCDKDAKSVRRVLPRIAGVALVLMTACAIFFFREAHILQQKIDLQNEQIGIIHLQRNLQAPSEAIYYDPVSSSRPLAEIRLKGFYKFGVEHFLPYGNVMYPGSMAQGKSEWWAVPSRETVEEKYRWTRISNVCIESWWTNRLARLCNSLAGDMNRGHGTGGYLKNHPAEFDKHIRPLIVRLLDAYNPSVRMKACDVLFAMGDRSELLNGIVEITATLPTSWCPGRGDAVAVIKKYALDIDVPPIEAFSHESYEQAPAAWKRIHLMVAELKKKYPMTDGTLLFESGI